MKILKHLSKFDKKRITCMWTTTKPIPQLLILVFLTTSSIYSFNGNKGEVKTIIEAPVFQTLISGIITSSTNEPLPGVTVLVKGTSIGTLSDFDGNYSIQASEGDVLVFSYLGMDSQSIMVSKKTSINVNMMEDTSVLDEVVVIGYGTVKRKNIVGSMSSASRKDLISNPQGDVLSSLQGQVSGAQITSSSGAPGAGFEIQIRGASSVSGGTAPLYIVDGVQIEADGSNIVSAENDQLPQIGALSFLNPDDIESINILKDASATAIYGSRGANGVVIITTRSGVTNNSRVRVSYTSTVTMVPDPIDLLDMEGYIKLKDWRTPGNARYSTNIGTPDEPIYIPRVYPADSIVEIDHQKIILQPTVSHVLNLSFNNSNEISNTAASVGYLRNNGLVKNTDYTRITSSLRYRLNASKKVTFDSNINTQWSKSNGVRYNGNGGATSSGIVQSMINTPPGAILSPQNSEGEDPEENDLSTPIDLVNEAVSNTLLLNVIASLGMDYKIMKDLTFRSQVATRLSYSESNLFYSKDLAQGRNQEGRVSLRSNFGERMDFQNTLNYSLALGDVNISALAGIESRIQQNSRRDTNNYGFALGLNGPYSIQEGTNLQIPTNSKVKSTGFSYFSRIQFDILDKYLVTGTYRADGSSKFGPNNKFGHFYSVGTAWKLKNETFLKNVNNVNQLTLRASYGTTGNDRIQNGLAFTNYGYAVYPDELNNSQSVLTIANLGDPDLKWETTTQTNVGLDAAFFRNRLSVSFDAYRKQTTDLLLAAEVPGYFGQQIQTKNIGRIDNEGLELSLSGNIIRSQKVRWRVLVTATRNIGKIVNLGDSPERRVSTGTSEFRDLGVLKVGHPIGTFFGLDYDGVYDFEDFEEFDGMTRAEAADLYDRNESYTVRDGVTDKAGSGARPGDVKFKNLTDEDGEINVITAADRHIIGDGNPDFFGGITNTLRFGNLGININVNYSVGGDIYNASKIFVNGIRSNNYNMSNDSYNNMWRPDNPEFTNPGILNTVDNGLRQESTYYVEDGSFLRLKRVHITYSFSNVLKQYGIQDFVVFISGNDLLTYTGYSGFDPEVRSNNPLVRGIDRASYPRAATISMGVNVTF
jgi:TonB-linked SusC/RagA family outer membrane protein